MDLSRSVLLPVDLQRAFDHPPWPRRWNGALDDNGLRLLDAWRASGRPIVHIRHDSVDPASTLRPGTPGHVFRPGFEPRNDEPVVAKSVNAAFIGTDLDSRLRRMGVDRVVTFGLSTDMCVSTTVRVGANLGYDMILVADACDCFDLPGPAGAVVPAESIHAAHVATLAFEFADVVDTRTLVDALSSLEQGPIG